MGQRYTSPDFGVLKIPGGYSAIKVRSNPGGLGTTGVIFLIGEATAGADYSLEDDLRDNAFGPNALADVLNKYKGGPLVDAYRAAITPSRDPNVQGAPSRIYLIKTNPSEKSSLGILQVDGLTDYGTIYDRSYGHLGNLIKFTVEEDQAEQVPTTDSFTYIPPVSTANITFRANGGSSLAAAVTAAMTPTTFVSTVNGLSGVSATGGALRTVIPGIAGNLTVTAPGANVVVISYDSTWTTTPSVGDTLTIPNAGPLQGGADQNVGAYVVTGATSSTITATKLSDAGAPGAVEGTITAPAAIGSSAVTATTDFSVYSPVTISNEDADLTNGLAKSLEVNQLETGTDLFERCAFVLGTTTAVTWLSKEDAPKQIVSDTEYRVNLVVDRQVDSIHEEEDVGGRVGLALGYEGTTCSVVISSTSMVLTLTGGDSAALSPITIQLEDFPTIADLASYIATIPGFLCSAGSSSVSSKSPLALDEGTFTGATTWGNKTMRVKLDAADFFDAVSNSPTIQFGDPEEAPASGLPEVSSGSFLTGGLKGATTDAIVQGAVDALKALRGNFVVPCFSRDASEDIEDELTDSGSTYTIEAINAYVDAHCIAMSVPKKRRNRQAFLSFRGTFDDAKDAAQTLASFRSSLSFQDVRDVGADGVQQFQPYVVAAKAAGMQAAGFYRAIFNKLINISGVLQAEGDFKDSDDDQVEDGLDAGLLMVKRRESGGFSFISDQTTYSKDDNFVYNSIQAIYVADVMAVSAAQRMEDAFVGQTLADVSSAAAVSAFEFIMDDFRRLRLIAPSDEAPKGFRNLVIRVRGPVMTVEAEVYEATALYFVPITLNINQISRSSG